MSGALETDPYQEEVLRKLAAAASRYNDWLFERAQWRLGGRVVDVGAGLGTFTELASRRAREVVALEPDAQLIELLRERFRRTENVRLCSTSTHSESPAGSSGDGSSALPACRPAR